jgi:hypothetical protein
MAEYTYLIGSILTIIIWAIFYYMRKDLRKEMLVMGTIIAIIGLFLEFFIWTRDWWAPKTISGTVIGIEDAIFGFGIGGISTVLYEVVFRKKVLTGKYHHKKKALAVAIFSFAILLSALFAGLHSFYATSIGLLLPALAIYHFRKDLILKSMTTGALMAAGAFAGFFIMNIIQPTFVQEWWMLKNLSGLLLFGIPVEDVIWFFLVGTSVGCIYRFWKGGILMPQDKLKKIN